MAKSQERKEIDIDFSRDRKFFEQEGSSRVITSGSLYMFFALFNAGCIWIFIILATGWAGLKYFGLTTALNGIVGLIGIGISRYFIAEIKTAFIINEAFGRLKATTYSKILFLIGLVLGIGMILMPFLFGFFIKNQLLRECIFASGFATILLYSNYVLQIGLEIKNRYDIIAFLSIFGGVFLLLGGYLFVSFNLNPFWFAFHPFLNISTFFLFFYFFNKQAPYSIKDIFHARLRTATMRERSDEVIRDLIEEHQIWRYLKNSLYSMLTNIQNSRFFEDILFFFAAIYLAIFEGAAYQGFALSLLTVLMTYGAVKSVILYYSAPLNIEIAEACAKKSHKTIENSINDSTRITSILALGFLTAMVAVSREILFFLHEDLINDVKVLNMAQLLFNLIILSQFIYGYSTLFGNALIGSGNAQSAAIGFLVTIIIITGLSPLFINFLDILGIGFVMLISASFLLPYTIIQLKRKLKVNYRVRIYRLLPNLLILFLILWFFPFATTLSFFFGIAIAAFIYLMLNPFFGVSIPEDLQMINDLFNTLKLKLFGNIIVFVMKKTYNFSPLNNDKIVLEGNKLVLMKK